MRSYGFLPATLSLSAQSLRTGSPAASAARRGERCRLPSGESSTLAISRRHRGGARRAQRAQRARIAIAMIGGCPIRRIRRSTGGCFSDTFVEVHSDRPHAHLTSAPFKSTSELDLGNQPSENSWFFGTKRCRSSFPEQGERDSSAARTFQEGERDVASIDMDMDVGLGVKTGPLWSLTVSGSGDSKIFQEPDVRMSELSQQL